MQHHLKHFIHESNVLACDHLSFFDISLTDAQRCSLATIDCAEEFQFINLFAFSYCTLQGHWLIAVFVSLFLIFLIFRFIQAVVEEYLAPSIEFITEWLGLSQALGAVTLLALANGAGDVVTAIAASNEKGGLSYIVGSIYGAGLFVCSIVVAVTIMQSKRSILIEPSLIWRDVGFYILSTVVIIIFAFIGSLNVLSACLLLMLYVLMVLVVVIQEHYEPQPMVNEETKQKYLSQTVDQRAEQFKKMELIQLPEDKTTEEQQAQPKKWRNIMKKLKEEEEEEKEEEWKDMSLTDQVMYVMDIPFMYVRKLTLPPCDHKHYSKMQAIVFPIPGVLFIYFCSVAVMKWYIALPLVLVGAIFSIIIYVTTQDNEPPKYFIFFMVFGTLGSIMWSYLVCGLLIDVLQFLGMISKLNKTYMGLTVIAVGNALPDAITTIAFAKQGYAVMGLTGAYAGQLFGLLVGFGISLLKTTLSSGPQDFNLFDLNDLKNNFMNIFVIAISLLNLVITFVYGVANKYRYTKHLAFIIGSLYVIFFLVATTHALHSALQ